MLRPQLPLRNARSRSISFRPEALEPRQLLAAKPAAQVSFVETPDAGTSGTYTLRVVGTPRNDSIFITDDGKHAAGSLRFTANGTQLYTNQHPLSTVAIATLAGKDKVLYELQGTLSAGPSEMIFAGSADPLGSTSTGGGTGPASGANKGGGDLQMTVNIPGPISPGANLTIFAAADRKGATTLTLNHSGPVDGQLTVAAGRFTSPNSRTGPVTFNMNSTAFIRPSGTLVAGAVGGSGRTVMNANYAGTNNGDIRLVGIGQGPNDNLAASILMDAGSTGTVGAGSPAQLADGGAAPKVRFLVARGGDSTSKVGIDAQLSTTSRRSVSTHTANVSTLAAGKDSTVA